MTGRLAGKRALITGAGRGIGAGIALGFAREGASVVVHYGRSAEPAAELTRQIHGMGGKAITLGADLADPEQVIALTVRALDAFDGLDILVSNAGVYNTQHLFDEPLETFDRMLAINLRAPFLLCRAIGQAMEEQGSGSLIVVASGAGLQPRPGFETSPGYVASRAGVVMLTKRIAIDLAPRVRANVLIPGIVDSKPKPWSPDRAARYAARHLLERPGQVSDVVPGAIFLASDESAFMTGEVLTMDGGMLIANAYRGEDRD